jgi:integrase
MAKRKNKYGLKQDGRGIWHCDFSVAGTRVQRSTYTDSKTQAEEWCAQVATDLWRQVKLGEQPKLEWTAAVELWFKAKLADRKRDLANDRDKARIVEPLFAGKVLDGITTPDVDCALDQLTQQRGLSNGTRNRYRSFIIGVMNFCRKRGYAVAEVHPEKRREPKEKVVWITKDQATRLLAELRPTALHLARMAEFSLATGLRQSNVTGLRWDKVDLERRIAWVRPDDAKADEWISTPLSDWGMAVLMEARSCEQHGHDVLVFTYYGRHVEQPANSAWHKACVRVGDLPEEWTWHCMRHTWASWPECGARDTPNGRTRARVLCRRRTCRSRSRRKRGCSTMRPSGRCPTGCSAGG